MRKIDDDRRVFNSEWGYGYQIDPHSQGVVFLDGQSRIAVMKEYNVNRHHASKHCSQFVEILGQARVDKIEHLKKSIKDSTRYKKESEPVRKLSSKLCESMEEKGLPFVTENSSLIV